MKRLVILITFLLTFLFTLPTPIFAAGPKRIEVDLTHQRLYASEGPTLFYNFPISSGTLKHPTPTGTFYPWGKYLTYDMIGGSKVTGDYYDLPNVPYVVYFY